MKLFDRAKLAVLGGALTTATPRKPHRGHSLSPCRARAAAMVRVGLLRCLFRSEAG